MSNDPASPAPVPHASPATPPVSAPPLRQSHHAAPTMAPPVATIPPGSSPQPTPASFGPSTAAGYAQPVAAQPPYSYASPGPARPGGTAVALDYAQQFGGQGWLAIRRIVKSSFYLEHATAAERLKLESGASPVTSPLAQDYAGWRRSTLWLCVALQSIVWIMGIFDANWYGEDTVGSARNVLVVNSLTVSLLGAQLLAIALLVVASIFWANIRVTRQCARFSWVVQFFSPFLILMVPLHTFLDLPNWEGIMLGLAIGAGPTLQLIPRVIGLFPGLVRSSLTLKTLLPEASVPGWVTIALCPLYALLFAILTVISVQSAIGWTVTLSMLCMTVAPLLCVVRARGLMSPLAPIDAHRLVTSLRRQMLALTGVALVSICLWYFIGPDFIKIPFLSVALVVVGIFANIFLLTVVSSDLLLGLMREAFEMNKLFVGTPLHTQLEAKFAELGAVGFTNVAGGEREVAGQIGGLMRSATRASKEWLAANSSGANAPVAAPATAATPVAPPPPTQADPLIARQQAAAAAAAAAARASAADNRVSPPPAG